MKTIKSPSKTTLRRAAKLLQDAHDYIERFGFDILEYGTYSQNAVRLQLEEEYGKSEDMPKMCWIGTMRYLANPDLDPAPEGPAKNGDGPELELVLRTLDTIAQRRLPAEDRHTIANEYESEDGEGWEVGRFIERLGFNVMDKAIDKYPSPSHTDYTDSAAYNRDYEQTDAKRLAYQQAYALRTLRMALTEIYKDA